MLAFSIQTQIFACMWHVTEGERERDHEGGGKEYIKRLFFIHRFSHALDLGTIEKDDKNFQKKSSTKLFIKVFKIAQFKLHI